MTCKSCSSKNREAFSAEINVHCGGWEGLKKPGVLVFPKLLICLDCGFAEFAVPETELARLASGFVKGKPEDGRRALKTAYPGMLESPPSDPFRGPNMET